MNCLPWFYETETPKLGFSYQRKLIQRKKKKKKRLLSIVASVALPVQSPPQCSGLRSVLPQLRCRWQVQVIFDPWLGELLYATGAAKKGKTKENMIPPSRSHQLGGENKMCVTSKMQN